MKPFTALLLCCFLWGPFGIAAAQDEEPLPVPTTPAQCGQVVEDEFLQADNTDSNGHILWYALDVPPGTTVTLRGDVPGDTLTLGLAVFNPDRSLLEHTSTYDNDDYGQPTLITPATSSRGTHYIAAVNVSNPLDYKLGSAIQAGSNEYSTTFGAWGFFRLAIECVTPEGDILAPTSSTPSVSGQTVIVPNTIPTTTIPIVLDTPINTTITPDATALIGYPITAPVGSNLVLTLTRITGTTQVGVVILGPDGSIVFHAAMIGTPTLTVQIDPTIEGMYTVVTYPLSFAQPVDAQPAAVEIFARLK